MLNRSLGAQVACAVVACATLLSACAQTDLPGTEPSVQDDNPFRADGDMERLPFSDVTTEHCLGDYLLDAGEPQVTGCTTPGAMPVVAVTTFGESALGTTPSNSEVATLADTICEPLIHEWTSSSATESRPLQVLVYPEVWDGSATVLVCAVRV